MKKTTEEQKMDPDELSKYILAGLKKQGADDVVVCSAKKNSLLVKYSNNLINTTKTLDLTNINVFAAIDKCLVTTNIIDLTKRSADLSVKNLVHFAKVLQKNEEYMGIAEGKFKYSKLIETYDKKLDNLGENSIDYVEGAINLALESGAKRSSGVLDTTTYEVSLFTSHGIEAKEKGTKIYFSIRCFVEKDASGHMVSVSRNLKGFNWKTPVRRAAEISKMGLNPKICESGKYDLLFDHLPYANIINTVGSAASIFSVEAGLSFLQERLGKTVGNRIITISDDATYKNGFNTSRFDGEGVPSQKNTIIDKGVLNTYLHNTSTARRYKTKTTANAGIISPTPTNIILEKGELTKEEMISSIKKGIYVTNVWYTRFQNYATGDFSTIPRDGAFLIENGRIKCPVKDLRISDNVLNILKSTEGLTKESWQIYGWEVDTPIITPMALVRNINITRSEK